MAVTRVATPSVNSKNTTSAPPHKALKRNAFCPHRYTSDQPVGTAPPPGSDMPRNAWVSDQPSKPKNSVWWPAKGTSQDRNSRPHKTRSQCNPTGGTGRNQKRVQPPAVSPGVERLVFTAILPKTAHEFVKSVGR